MKKGLKKIMALAAALMMVPVMTANAAPPVNAISTTDNIYEQISSMFPGLTSEEAEAVTEMTYIHSEYEMTYGAAAVSFDRMVEEVGIPLNNSSYGHIFAAYGVVFAGASRDWCIRMGVDPVKLDAMIIKLGGSAGASPSVQSASGPVWKQDSKGWWLENPDGSYLTNQWYQSPDSGLWYYMGADGYMLTNTTTPDGCTVNADGVWVQ